jgi:hypothetical protein
MTKSRLTRRLAIRYYKFIILILITFVPKIQVTIIFGFCTLGIKLWKIFISDFEFIVLVECKVQFVSHCPVDCHLTV